MGSEELAANFFRITQTEAKIQREDIQGKDAANQAHHDMGAAVRGFILEQDGAPPEQLPMPAESVRQVRAHEQKRILAMQQAERQPSLFAKDTTDEGEVY